MRVLVVMMRSISYLKRMECKQPGNVLWRICVALIGLFASPSIGVKLEGDGNIAELMGVFESPSGRSEKNARGGKS